MRCGRAFDEGARIIDAAIERDREWNKALVAELFVECLPDRQIFAAASP
jgi:hypothetical protein